MVKEEIVSGLENAVSRGESLEKAMNSMISAGYSPDDVKEAASSINMGTIGRIATPEIKPEIKPSPTEETQEIQSAYAPEPQEVQETQQPAPQYQKLPVSTPAASVQEKPKRRGWLIFLIVMIVLILGGIVALMIFGESILSAFFPKVA